MVLMIRADIISCRQKKLLESGHEWRGHVHGFGQDRVGSTNLPRKRMLPEWASRIKKMKG